MSTATALRESATRKRIFPGWSIRVPDSFLETFVDEGAGYWHGYDATRSVSLTSVVLTEHGRLVAAERIVNETRKLERGGTPVTEMPTGHIGWAFTTRADAAARASRLLSGGIAVDGVILIATITADDVHWARVTWLSIRSHPRGH